MLGCGLPSPMEKSHMLRKSWEKDSKHSLLPMSSCPHGLALTPWLLPVHPWSCPPPGGAVSPKMAALSSDAAGRRGWDTCVFRLLWKETVALKGCPGSQSPELWSWAPTHGLRKHQQGPWVVEPRVHTHNFGSFIWSFHFPVMPP